MTIATFFQKISNFYIQRFNDFSFHSGRFILCWPFSKFQISSIQSSRPIIIFALDFSQYMVLFCWYLGHLVKSFLNLLFLTIFKLTFEKLHSRIFFIPKRSCNIYNLRQNILNKIEKSRKSRQEKKSLIYPFACFFDCYRQSLISGKETGH